MKNLLNTFKAVADPTRLRILRMLFIKPLCVCEVMSVLKMAQSTTSRHLQILCDAGLIEELPGGTWTVYRLPLRPANPAAKRLLSLVKDAEVTEVMKKDAHAATVADRERICRMKQ